ncbi:hypothetical protein KKE60_06125 [Patescibacteria group bacterium]|nr:hypothetical protein [Patescibacteria group bacterium]
MANAKVWYFEEEIEGDGSENTSSEQTLLEESIDCVTSVKLCIGDEKWVKLHAREHEIEISWSSGLMIESAHMTARADS